MELRGKFEYRAVGAASGRRQSAEAYPWPGTRIEVVWCMESSGQMVWWPATVIEQNRSSEDRERWEEEAVVNIEYDARPQEGFEVAEAQAVSFIGGFSRSGGQIFDVEQGECHPWRLIELAPTGAPEAPPGTGIEEEDPHESAREGPLSVIEIRRDFVVWADVHVVFDASDVSGCGAVWESAEGVRSLAVQAYIPWRGSLMRILLTFAPDGNSFIGMEQQQGESPRRIEGWKAAYLPGGVNSETAPRGQLSRALSGGDQERECPICFEEFDDSDCVKTLTLCNHAFCKRCVMSALAIRPPSNRGDCPLCRRSVKLKDLRYAAGGHTLVSEQHLQEQEAIWQQQIWANSRGPRLQRSQSVPRHARRVQETRNQLSLDSVRILGAHESDDDSMTTGSVTVVQIRNEENFSPLERAWHCFRYYYHCTRANPIFYYGVAFAPWIAMIVVITKKIFP